MSDDNNSASVDVNKMVKDLGEANKRIAMLEGQLTTATSALETHKASAAKAMEERNAFEAQFKEMTAKSAELEVNLTEATSQVQDWTTKFADLSNTSKDTASKLAMYEFAAQSPDTMSLIPKLHLINPGDSEETMKAALKEMGEFIAGQTASAANASIQQFQQGGQPPAGPGGNPGPTSGAPKTAKEAWQMAKSVISDAAAFDRYSKMAIELESSERQQPA